MGPSRQGSALAAPRSAAEVIDTSRPTIRRNRSLRSLLTCFFKSSKQDKRARKAGLSDSGSDNSDPDSVKKERLTSGRGRFLSTISLPIQVWPSTSSTSSPVRSEFEVEEGRPLTGHGLPPKIPSTTSQPSRIRPPFVSHVPSSSSSSASSLEFVSDASTAATSPSASSPSVLIKSPSSQSISTLDHATACSPSAKSRESSPTRVQSSAKAPKQSKRVPENYRKQPSPLSTVTDAHSPYAPESSVQPERSNSFLPKHRSSLGNFILRRSQSHSDLTDLTTDDLPLFPQMPCSTPPPRPASSGSLLSHRTLTLRRRPKADQEAPTSYSQEEKLEHRSILRADPAGTGFHLYPTGQPENLGRRSISGGSSRPRMHARPPMGRNINEDAKKNGWAGPDGYNGRSGLVPPTGRGWKDPRGRGFRRGVTPQVIMEEAGDIHEQPQAMSSSPSALEYRRQRPDGYSHQQHQPFRSAMPMSPVELPKPTVPFGLGSKSGGPPGSSPEKNDRRQSLHNNWNSIQSQMHHHQNGSPYLQVPTVVKHHGEDSNNLDEDLVLRKLQQGALRFMDSSDENNYGFCGDPVTIDFTHPNELSVMGGDRHLDRLPVIRIERV